ELAVDDGLAVRLEDDAGILPSVFVREPELADIDDRTLMFDMAIQIEETKVFGTQERRYPVHVVLAACVVLDLVEPQHPGACAVEHDLVIAVEFGHHARFFTLRLRSFLQEALSRPRVGGGLVEGDGSNLKLFGNGLALAVVLNV